FSRVKVHADAAAAASARQLGARAYTLGPHVVFGAHEYAPTTESGCRLLAHELTHTLQQPDSPRPDVSGVELGRAGDRWEREAAAASSEVGAHTPGAPLRVTPTGPRLQRQASPEVEAELEAVTPQEAQQLRSRGIELPRVSPQAADPRNHSDYIDRRMNA